MEFKLPNLHNFVTPPSVRMINDQSPQLCGTPTDVRKIFFDNMFLVCHRGDVFVCFYPLTSQALFSYLYFLLRIPTDFSWVLLLLMVVPLMLLLPPHNVDTSPLFTHSYYLPYPYEYPYGASPHESYGASLSFPPPFGDPPLYEVPPSYSAHPLLRFLADTTMSLNMSLNSDSGVASKIVYIFQYFSSLMTTVIPFKLGERL